MELKDILKNIDHLKSEIDKLRPIVPERLQRIMQKFRLDWNFHSNNIEGNSLTFGETKTFLLHEITAKGKPLKDHLDIKGHNEAILLLEEIVHEDRPLTESFIREMHEIILHEPYQVRAKTPDGKDTVKWIEIGKYKTQSNHVETTTGEILYFTSPEETPAEMNDLMDWYKKSHSDKLIHPLQLAALFHYDFIRIHPFDDGNGRMARILMNMILMLKGFPPVIIKTQNRQEYYSALQQADGGNTEAFVSYIGEQLIHSLELYLKGAKGENIEEPDDIDKEIALFRAKHEAGEVKIKRSKEAQKDIFENSIRPFLKKLFSKLDKIDDMVSASRIFIKKDDKEYSFDNHRKLMYDKASYIFSNEINFPEIIFGYEWDGFLEMKGNHLSFKYQIGVKFIFTRNRYIIRYIIIPSTTFSRIPSFASLKNHQVRVEKLYHENLTEEECQKIISPLVKDVLKAIDDTLAKKK